MSCSNCNIKSFLTSTPELSMLLASFLPPAASRNFLLASKEMLTFDSNDKHSPQTKFMNTSIRQSLVSIMKERPEFSSIDVASFLKGIGMISSQNINQVVIAGSLILQAIHGNGGFEAGDVDIFATVEVLSPMRKLLVDFGFVLTGITTSYRVLNSNKIHHVESYSLVSDDAEKTTVKDGIKLTYNKKRVKKFLFDRASPYVMDPDFPFSREPRRKHIDLVVTSAASVSDAIDNFDISMCRARFDGRTFVIPELSRIFARQTRLTRPEWASLLNRYATLHFSAFKRFYPMPVIFRRIPDHSPTRVRVDFARQCIQRLCCNIPDCDGIFQEVPRNQELSDRYVITLHNMLVKISRRVIKYSKRGFVFTDISVDAFNPNRKYETTTSDPTNTQTEACHTRKNSIRLTVTDPVKRVKVKHGRISADLWC